MNARAHDYIRAPLETIVERKVDADVALVSWNSRNARAGDHEELVLACDRRRIRLVLEDRMIRAVDDEVIVERSFEVAVLDEPAQALHALRQAQLDTGAQRIADVVEEADVGLRPAGGLKQNVVAIAGVEAADVPAQPFGALAAQTNFNAPGNDLMERRIGEECVG